MPNPAEEFRRSIREALDPWDVWEKSYALDAAKALKGFESLQEDVLRTVEDALSIKDFRDRFLRSIQIQPPS